MIRTALVTLLFLVGLGLSGYLFLQHPEGARLLERVAPDLARRLPRVVPPTPSEAPAPPPEVAEETVARPEPRLPTRPLAAPLARAQDMAADGAKPAHPRTPPERVMVEERIVSPPPSIGNSNKGDTASMLSDQDIEAIVSRRRAIQQELGGG